MDIEAYGRVGEREAERMLVNESQRKRERARDRDSERTERDLRKKVEFD